MKNEISTILEGEVVEIMKLESSLETLTNELQLNPIFKQYLEYQKEVNDKIQETWDQVESEMIEHDIKQLKGDFGTVTLAERLNWDTTNELPNKFYKKVVDTKRLSDTFRLEGKAPRGATPSYTKYLTKRLNIGKDQ